MNMETDEPPKLDNGVGGSRATKTGKPERVGESGDEPINLILGEIQLLLAEKRTALSSLRTGIAVFALTLSVLSVLIATSRYYSFGKVMPLLVPLLLLNLGLVILGSWLIYISIHRIRHYEHRIRELTQKYHSIAEFIE